MLDRYNRIGGSGITSCHQSTRVVVRWLLVAAISKCPAAFGGTSVAGLFLGDTMSIDARIAAVTIIAPDRCATCHGTGKYFKTNWDDCPSCHGASKNYPGVRIHLVAREHDGVAGQNVLTIVNPPTLDPDVLAGMIGTEIWGGSGDIMVGDTKWANRIGYTRIELV